MMPDLLFWVVCGALAGWIGSMLAPVNSQTSSLAYVVIGIAGALIGGALSRATGAAGNGSFDTFGALLAVFGAVVLVIILVLLPTQKHSP